MIPYYSPNLSLAKVIKSLSIAKAEAKTCQFFRDLTNKKYILLTASCRSALYLAYRALGETMNVLVSPLTCSAALDPIHYSKNKIFFSDISEDTLNMEIGSESRAQDIGAIQVIHLGGVPADIESIMEFARQSNCLVIEDCAQSFGAQYKGEYTGSFGDVACFSLIKNAYGIGGGILATNNFAIYSGAQKYQDKLEKIALKTIVYRIIRNIIETHRAQPIFDYMFRNLMKMKIKYHDDKKRSEEQFWAYVKKPRRILFKIFIQQTLNLAENHGRRVANGLKILANINQIGICKNYKNIDMSQVKPSFTKFFAALENFDSSEGIKKLNAMGIGAKHLEQKFDSFYQINNNHLSRYKSARFLGDIQKYNRIHNSLVSLPLIENLTNEDIAEISKKLEFVTKPAR